LEQKFTESYVNRKYVFKRIDESTPQKQSSCSESNSEGSSDEESVSGSESEGEKGSILCKQIINPYAKPHTPVEQIQEQELMENIIQ
jgi:hypothetical protein